jgi:DNA-binding transcriptional ArsR family regulator
MDLSYHEPTDVPGARISAEAPGHRTEHGGTCPPDLAPQHLRRALAQAVAHPRTARFVTEENDLLDRPTLDEAVDSERAFAVQVQHDVLALDADHAGGLRILQELARRLLHEGLIPVLLASGGLDRYHLFARVRDPKLRESLARRAKDNGVDQRQGHALIRPPMTPHRSGELPRLLSPDSMEEAVEALRSRPWRELPEGRREQLRLGLAYRDYASGRSGVEQALLTSMYQHGWTLGEAYEELIRPSNAGGAKLQEVLERSGREAAWRHLRGGWTNARRFVREKPAITRPQDADGVLAALRDLVLERAWPGAAGSTDRAVLLELIKIGMRTGRLTVGASQRRLAELVGSQRHQTVGASLRRLREAGWVARERRGQREQANEWRLLQPPLSMTAPVSTSREGGCEVSGALSVRGHDAFRRGALGAKAAQLYEGMSELTFTHPDDIAADLRMAKSTVRAKLAKLAEVGLAERDSAGGWRRQPGDLNEVAAKLGTAGTRDAQRQRHDDERFSYTGKHPRKPHLYKVLRAPTSSGEGRRASTRPVAAQSAVEGPQQPRRAPRRELAGATKAQSVRGTVTTTSLRPARAGSAVEPCPAPTQHRTCVEGLGRGIGTAVASLPVELTVQEARESVGRVPVEVVPGPVVAASGPGVGVSGGVLHVAEARAGVQRESDEGVPEVVRMQGGRFVGYRGRGESTEQPPDGDPVHRPSGSSDEQRPAAPPQQIGVESVARGGRQGNRRPRAPLARHPQHAVATLAAQVLHGG